MNTKLNSKILILLLAGGVLLIGVGVAKSVFFKSASKGDPSGRPYNQAKKPLYYCPMHPQITSDRPGECPICHMKLVKREEEGGEGMGEGVSPKELTLQELLSMKPGEVCLLHKCKMGNCMIALTEELARLGKCPHCGEDLGVILKENAPEGYGKVKLLPEKQQLIGIKTSPAKRIPLKKTLRTVGTIANDPELYQAQAEFVQALQSFESAKTGGIPEVIDQASRLLDSTRVRLTYMGLNEELLKELETGKKPDRSLLFATQGDLLVWVYANVYEYELPLIQLGQEVSVEIPSLPGKVFRGKIRAADPKVDPVTRSTRVRLQLDSAGEALRPDTYVNVVIEKDFGEVLAIPKEAVFDTGERQIVFVDLGGGQFEPREIVAGAKTEDFIEIRGGVREGERVVTSGNFLIDSESRLKAALDSAVSGGGHQH